MSARHRWPAGADAVVLVVTDDAEDGVLLRKALSDRYDVVLADTDTEGLVLAATASPMLVVADLGTTDGEQFLTAVKARVPDVPVVVVTALAEEKVQLLTRGASDVLTKPISVPELLARVDNLARMRLAELARLRAQARAEGLLEAAPDATVVVDSTGRIVLANRQAEVMFGYPREEMLGQPVELLVPEGPRKGHAALRTAFSAHPRSRAMGTALEPVALRKDGSTLPVDISLSPLDTIDGPLVIASVRDVSAARTTQERLRALALHDSLTGLPNRMLLMDHLDLELADLNRHAGLVAVLYLDLDSFKFINDTFGHHTGDVVLLEVSERLTTAVRPQDTVSRLGGDEFVVVCGAMPDEKEIELLAQRLVQVVQAPIIVEGNTVATSASVGVALTRNTKADPESLVRSADQAMYVAKNRGPGLIQLFDTEADQLTPRG